MAGRQKAGMPLGDVLLVWKLRVLLESEGISKDLSLDFFSVPAAAIATLLLAFACSFPLSALRGSAARGKASVLLMKVSSVAVCSCW